MIYAQQPGAGVYAQTPYSEPRTDEGAGGEGAPVLPDSMFDLSWQRRGGGHPTGTCKTCSGTGQQTTSRRETRGNNNVVIQQIITCPACGGRGVIIDQPCLDCGGSGKTEHEEILSVTIPVGVEEGMALRISERGKGLPEFGGKQHGDLYLRIRVHIPEQLSSDELDIYRKLRDLAGKHRSSWWHR